MTKEYNFALAPLVTRNRTSGPLTLRPMLSADEEQELAEKAALPGDLEAAKKS